MIWRFDFGQITQCTISLRYYVKDKVCVPSLSKGLDEIKIKFTDAVNAVTQNMISNV